MPKGNETFLETLYSALAADVGIVVESNDPDRLRQKLYAVRRAANDPDLDQLSITASRTSPESQLWIVKKNASSE